MTLRRNKRDRQGNQGATVSLFPFLAVLLCTMGTLVMILVVVSRNSSGNSNISEPLEPVATTETAEIAKTAETVDSATTTNSAATNSTNQIVFDEASERRYQELLERYGNATADDMRSELESVRWFLEELQGVQKRTSDALVQERERLAATERAIGFRMDEVAVLQKNIQTLNDQKTGKNQNETSLQEEEIRLKTAKIETLRQEIETLRGETENPNRSYAVVPYQGKNGTFRRPIFIECNQDGVFLQPENVPFSFEDFVLAQYPQNPFAAAIRTTERFMIEDATRQTSNETTDSPKNQATNSTVNETVNETANRAGQATNDAVVPYPLLIVRPGGAEKYYAAVAALASWGGDYGYEFVDEDCRIEYPSPNLELRRRVEETVALARYKLAAPTARLLAEAKRFEAAAKESGESPFQTTGTSNLQSQLGSNVKLASGSSPILSNDSAISDDFAASNDSDNRAGDSFASTTAANLSAPERLGDLNSPNADSGLLLANENSAFGASNAGFDSGLSSVASQFSPNAALAQNGSGTGFASQGLFSTRLPQYNGVFATAANRTSNGFADSLATANGTEAATGIGTVSSNAGANGLEAVDSNGANDSNGIFDRYSNSTNDLSAETSAVANVGEKFDERSGEKRDEAQNAVSRPGESLQTGESSPIGEFVSGDSAQGIPLDASKRLVSQIQGGVPTTAIPANLSPNDSPSLEESWKRVGDAAFAQNASGTVAEGSTEASGSNATSVAVGSENASFGTSADVATVSENAGASPSWTANVEKNQKKPERDVEPAYASSSDQKAINYTEQFRKPADYVNERQIRVECYADKLVFPKQSGLKKAEVVAIAGDVSANADAVYQPIVRCVKNWGTAGRNASWSPWLSVEIRPGGERRFDELKRLIESQGMPVRQSNSNCSTTQTR